MIGLKGTDLSKLGVEGYWICRRPYKKPCEWRNSLNRCTILSREKPCVDEEKEAIMAEEQKVREDAIKKERGIIIEGQIKLIDAIIESINTLMNECIDGDAVEHLANVVARSLKAKIALKLYIDKKIKGIYI